jgi:hypothetical protein
LDDGYAAALEALQQQQQRQQQQRGLFSRLQHLTLWLLST